MGDHTMGDGAATCPTWRVAIAEDDAALRALLRHVLTRDARFLIVGEAADGEAAVELGRRPDVDLLVLDLSMPLLDGVEVLRRVADRTDLRTVVLTGLEQDREPECREAGAADYLRKSTAFDRLTDQLAAVLA